MEKKEKIFADGIIANGWVNLDVKRGRSGNLYVELDTFEPRKAASKPKVAEPDELLL